MKLIFILNARSANAQSWAQRIQSNFTQYQFQVWRTEHANHASTLAKKACGRCDVLISVGGDGTLNEVINGCLQSEVTPPRIAVLAAGTANDFIKSANLKGSIPELLHLLATGTTRTIDVGWVEFKHKNKNNQEGRRFFVNGADVGLGAEIVQRVESYPGSLSANWIYILATIKTLLSYKAEEIAVSSAGKPLWSGRSLLLAICKGKYFGSGIAIAPHASLDDGKLAITLIGNAGILQFLKHLKQLRTGKRIDHEEVRYFQTRDIEVTSASPRALEVDGEFVGYTPARFSLKAKRLILVA